MNKKDVELFLKDNNLELKQNSYGLFSSGYYYYYIENKDGKSLCCIAVWQYGEAYKYRTIGNAIKKMLKNNLIQL